MTNPDYKFFRMPLITNVKPGDAWPRAAVYIAPWAIGQLIEIAQYGYRPLADQEWLYLEYATRCQAHGTIYVPLPRSGKCILGNRHKGDHALELIARE